MWLKRCIYTCKLSGIMKITGTGNDAAARRLDESNKGVVLKYYPLFTDCISQINNTQKDNVKQYSNG